MYIYIYLFYICILFDLRGTMLCEYDCHVVDRLFACLVCFDIIANLQGDDVI